MKTLQIGIRRARRAPLALLPHAAQGLVTAVLIVVGAFPALGATAPSAALFPLGTYFDVEQSLAYAPAWPWLMIAVAVGIAIRGAVLAASLWFLDDERGSFARAWIRACRLGVVAALALLPAAALYFIGVATRYAPFVWIGAVLGFVPAALFARMGLRIEVAGSPPRGKGVPTISGFLAYTYVVVIAAAAMTVSQPLPAALIAALLGVVSGIYVIGWREQLESESHPAEGTVVTALTVGALALLAAAAAYDRMAFETRPVGDVSTRGTLLLLGGADSTSRSGALVEVDPRDLGRARSETELLSYRGPGDDYAAADTRRDLDDVAETIAAQIAAEDRPRLLLGHSQAALIVDRILARGLPAPDRVAVLAPTPPVPPPVDVPPPGARGPGKPGGDVARVFARLLDVVSLQPFDIDAPASPTNLDVVVVRDANVPRLAVTALADAVWLERGWRRPGEINVMVVSDHVGVTNSKRALETTRRFFVGRDVDDDETSWRGYVVTALRFLFEPWRPNR